MLPVPHLGQAAKAPAIGSTASAVAMKEFLVGPRDTLLAKSLHKGQGLMGIPEIMEGLKEAGAGYTTTHF